MRSNRLAALSLAAAAFLAGAQTAPAPAGGVPLSLSRAVDQAKTYEARFQAAQAGFRADSEVLAQTRGLLLPEVSLSVSRNHNRLVAQQGAFSSPPFEYPSGGTSISLRQPIYRPESWARYQQAKDEVVRLEAVLASDRNRVVVDVVGAYLEALRAFSENRSQEAQLKSARGQADAAARGVPLGLVSASERDDRLARAEVAGLRALQAQAKLAEARTRLENMVGQPVTELLAPSPAALGDENLAIEDLAVLREKAQNASPEVRAARAAVEVAREGVTRAQAGHKPTLDLVAGRSKSTSESFSSVNQTYYNTSFGLQLSVPLYAGGRISSGVRQAVANQEKAQAQLDQTLRETSVLVEREFMTVRQALQRLRAYEALVNSAQQNLAASQQGLQSGNRSQLDVLDAQGQLESAQNEQAGGRLELLAARMRLQSMQGEIDDQTVARLDRLLVTPVGVSR